MLASRKEILFESIYKKANIIKYIKLKFGKNEFEVHVKAGELVINGQLHKFGSIVPGEENPKYKISCIRRTVETRAAGSMKLKKKEVFFLVGFIANVGDIEYQRYIVATDEVRKNKHDFSIISKR